VRGAHDTGLYGERRPTPRWGLPGVLLSAIHGSKRRPFRASCPPLQTPPRCVPSPRTARAHRSKVNSTADLTGFRL